MEHILSHTGELQEEYLLAAMDYVASHRSFKYCKIALMAQGIGAAAERMYFPDCSERHAHEDDDGHVVAQRLERARRGRRARRLLQPG